MPCRERTPVCTAPIGSPGFRSPSRLGVGPKSGTRGVPPRAERATATTATDRGRGLGQRGGNLFAANPAWINCSVWRAFSSWVSAGVRSAVFPCRKRRRIACLSFISESVRRTKVTRGPAFACLQGFLYLRVSALAKPTDRARTPGARLTGPPSETQGGGETRHAGVQSVDSWRK